MPQYIVGNWKQNGNKKLIDQFSNIKLNKKYKVVICPPYPLIPYAYSKLDVSIGAQNCSGHESGAYTSKVSASLLKELGCTYVIIGHSETRMYQGVTINEVVEKVKLALNSGLIPIVCIGEREEDYDSGKTKKVLQAELTILKEFNGKLIIAYEPLWAIGTGKTPTETEIERVLSFIKELSNCPTLYGGSVNPSNAKSLLNLPSLGGLLIGGVSLKPDSFEGLYS